PAGLFLFLVGCLVPRRCRQLPPTTPASRCMCSSGSPQAGVPTSWRERWPNGYRRIWGFVVENRTGMGGSLAAQALINAPPDGYTLLFMGPNNAIATSLYKKLPFDF